MTDILELQRAGHRGPMPPSSWRPFANTAMVTCGNGHVARVDKADHYIDDDGTITPSLDCPVEPCDWDVHVKLAGWADR